MKGIELYLKASFTLLAVFLSIFTAKAQEQDSIKSKALEEVVVVAKRGWVEGDKVVFQPTKQEKRLSNSPASLLQRMNLPMLKNDGNGETIQTIGGESVTLYINGQPASEIDVKTFWPKNAKRVEYMESPKDPTFRGARKVINIVTTEYEVGGVTRIDALQSLPGGGNYTAASKVEYKKMRYGLLFDGGYSRDHSATSSGQEYYRDLYYDNENYELISRTTEDHSFERDDHANISFSARFLANKKFAMTHTAKLSWNRNPGSGSESIDFWNPALFGGNSGRSFATSKRISPQISGDYFWGNAKNFAIPIEWSYIYGNNDASTWYTMGDLPEIYNATEETVNTLNVRVKPFFKPNNKFTFQLLLNGKFNWFSTLYHGSADTRNTQARQDISADMNIWWTISPKLFFLFTPGVNITMWKIGINKEKSILPKGSFGISWNPSYKCALTASIATFVFSPGTNETTPVLVKQTELIWRIGNPVLKPHTAYNSYFQFTWLPSNTFSAGLEIGYLRGQNNSVVNYEIAPKELGGLIGRESDNSTEDLFSMTANLSLSLFNSKLHLNVSPQLVYDKYHGLNSSSLTSLSGYAKANYTIGNVDLSLTYWAPKKFLTEEGMERTRQGDRLSFGVTYGIGNFYFNLRGDDLLHKKSEFHADYISPYYSYSRISRSNGRSLSVNITYTFDYGKKVDHNIQVEGVESVNTSVIK